MAKTEWSDRASYDGVLNRVNENRILLDTTLKRNVYWKRTVMKGKDILTIVLDTIRKRDKERLKR